MSPGSRQWTRPSDEMVDGGHADALGLGRFCGTRIRGRQRSFWYHVGWSLQVSTHPITGDGPNPRTKVSVVIPCHNQARFLPDAVASVQSQSHSDWECIIVNDGATDETGLVAESLARSDQRISVVHQSNLGLSAARNVGLHLASGRYVQFLDADDAVEPSKFHAQLRALAAIDGLALSYSDYRYCPEDDVTKTATPNYYPPPRFTTARPIWDLASRWETELSIPIHCFLFDARLFTDLGVQFDEGLPSHEDWDCLMQIFKIEPKVVHVAGALAVYRLHPASLSKNQAKMAQGYDLALEKQISAFEGDPETQERLLRKRVQMQRVYHPSAGIVARGKLRAAARRLRSWGAANLFTGRIGPRDP